VTPPVIPCLFSRMEQTRKVGRERVEKGLVDPLVVIRLLSHALGGYDATADKMGGVRDRRIDGRRMELPVGTSERPRPGGPPASSD
jgi:hypothetical protein